MSDALTVLELLKNPWVSFELLKRLYGIDKEDAGLWGSFQMWGMGHRRPREVLRPEAVDRHAFEAFLQQSGLLPLRIAAARLGMLEDSFVDVLGRLEETGALQPNGTGHSSQLVTESLLRSFHTRFPKLRSSVFSSHDEFCAALLPVIEAEIGVKPVPLYCATALAIDKTLPEFAHDFDCLTQEPVGLRYQVWLDLGKPMFLRPDICSVKTYVDHEQELKLVLFAGKEPEVPVALRKV